MNIDPQESYKRELWVDIRFYSAILLLNALHDPIMAVMDRGYPQAWGAGQLILFLLAGWRLTQKVIDRYHMK